MKKTIVMDEQQLAENTKTHKSCISWRPVIIGGVSGIALGGVMAEAIAITSHKPCNEENGETVLTEVNGFALVDNGIPVAQVSDTMSFSDAFNSAHGQVGSGGVFVWHGQVYSTFTEDEWNCMTSVERREFGSHIHIQYDESSLVSSQSTAQTPHAEENSGSILEQQEEYNGAQEPQEVLAQQSVNTIGIPMKNENVIDGVSPVGPKVEVIAYETVSNENGGQMDIAVVSVDGKEMGVYDVNQDGTADLLAVDANKNQRIEDNEIHDISSEGLSMQYLHDEYIAQNDPSTLGPDYINDGDVHNYMT